MGQSKVAVGLSGGVDSAVAAYLLKRQGYAVVGVTMDIWREQDDGCLSQAALDAAKVAEALGIEHVVADFKAPFKQYVVDRFLSDYTNGRTPNPCVVCNRFVKFACLLDFAKSLGATQLATGHYARVEKHPETGRLSLRQSVSAEKDQTYVLYNLTQEQLSKTLMPLGEYKKDDVRAIAAKAGIPVAGKPDSQEICFIPDHDYAAFIKRQTGRIFEKGHFVDQRGNILGLHQGVIDYTVGQRKGLGISLGKRVYVRRINVADNTVELADDDDVAGLSLTAGEVNFMALNGIERSLKAHAKTRYTRAFARCSVSISESGEGPLLQVNFDSPERAITPGQSVVVYDDDGYILCGGVIL